MTKNKFYYMKQN